MDPVTHHSMSPYTAFDNNPVFFADPSGADSIYNFDTQQYVINGKVVTQDEALAYANNGGNADGSNNNTPNENDTIYKKVNSDETVEVNDGIDKTIEVSEEDFETAKIFSMFIDKDTSNSNELVELYNEFYRSVNYYDGFSIANLLDYLSVEPNKTIPVPNKIQEAIVPPIFADLLSGGSTKAAKSSGWIIRSIFSKLPKSTKAKLMSAINNGIVSPKGRQGIIKLTATEAKATSYTHKLKILGKGGDLRIYGTMGKNGHIIFSKVMRH